MANKIIGVCELVFPHHSLHMNTFIYVINAISSPFIAIVLFIPLATQLLNRHNFAYAYQFICIYRDEIAFAIEIETENETRARTHWTWLKLPWIGLTKGIN